MCLCGAVCVSVWWCLCVSGGVYVAGGFCVSGCFCVSSCLCVWMFPKKEEMKSLPPLHQARVVQAHCDFRGAQEL